MTSKITINKRIAVGFIGGGVDSAIGSAHFAALNIDRKYSLDAGMFSIDRAANQKSADIYGVSSDRTYESTSDFIDNEKGKLDAVIVLSPTPVHYENINQALDAGLAVISEKALCTNSKDAELLNNKVTSQKKFLTVTFTYTGYPMVREAQHMIVNGLLGDLLSCHVEMPQESFIRSNSAGGKPTPQLWRQSDYEIPSVSLDLGSHVVNLLEFLTDNHIHEVSGMANHSGEVATLIDNVVAIGKLKSGTQFSLSWNKVSLGKRNGLSFSIYGSKAALSWSQEHPELITLVSKDGSIQLIDRSHALVTVASLPRYQRFKVGHPAGYIEAFANLYSDIAIALHGFNSGNNYGDSAYSYIHNAANSTAGLKVLEAIHESAANKKWIEIKR